MAPNEIFSRISPDLASHIFSYFFESKKPLYKATVDALAKQRNLRPVFIERKPRVERFTWMQSALSRHANEGVAAHLLQIWLVDAHSALLCDFLDGLGIAHEENGTVENLPESPAKEQLAAVIETLLAKHDPAVVALYLNAFQSLDDKGGWAPLGELLESDSRLHLGVAAAPIENQ